MQFVEQAIKGLFLIKPRLFKDERGFFMETFREEALNKALGYDVHFVQENESGSDFGVLRGLHYQQGAFAQAKLIRVLQGRVLDVAVDLRQGGKTFGQHLAIELTAEAGEQMFIPKGFAHGFVVLSEFARVSYKVDAYYAPEREAGVRFDDPDLSIDWRLPVEQLIVSKRDLDFPVLSDLDRSE
ncbi:dTDP-4-dehydrorhamnose 3,5-epimerase [Thiomicrospira pelophila]|uniref:dTDP-4-dehydrorhamnose 3,5-epimerase n=1 Tax=Thiomicrospira pelophila TaxID=934 RepID=UPI0004A6DAF0|nr:dTDP-4-dehydrorhamnose 3,5-epimerase [Thiomicrospira pelophila]